MNDENCVLGLTTIRENRGVTLQQISASTKISVRCLEAIEPGDFRKLPGGIYDTSYIRQYAKAIDYDESTLLEFYRRQMSGGFANSPETAPTRKGALSEFRPASTAVR